MPIKIHFSQYSIYKCAHTIIVSVLDLCRCRRHQHHPCRTLAAGSSSSSSSYKKNTKATHIIIIIWQIMHALIIIYPCLSIIMLSVLVNRNHSLSERMCVDIYACACVLFRISFDVYGYILGQRRVQTGIWRSIEIALCRMWWQCEMFRISICLTMHEINSTEFPTAKSKH